MTDRKIAVLFRKQINDGNFGSETAEMYTEEWLGDDVADDREAEIVSQMLAYARELVHRELSHSPSARVRQALNTPRQSTAAVLGPPEYDGDDDDGVPA